MPAYHRQINSGRDGGTQLELYKIGEMDARHF